MHTEVITTWTKVASLEREWDELLRNSRADTIFLSWDWIATWQKVVGHTLDPFLVVVRNGEGNLIGLAPFYVSKLRLLNLVPFKTLRIMADLSTGSEYGDWIVHTDDEENIVNAIVNELMNSKDYWDTIWMPRMSGWTGALERITDCCEDAGILIHSRTYDFAYFDLPKSVQLYEESFSAKGRQQLRRQGRKVFSQEGVEITTCEKPEQLDHFLEALFELHYKRWQLRGEVGSFRRASTLADFYRGFTRLALEKGQLRLMTLTQNREIQCVQIGYVYNNTFHQLQEGFNPDFVNGAGNVLRHEVIKKCIDAGLDGYDFLGEMTEHKRRWGALNRSGYDLFLAHPSLKNRALFSKEIWPTGRYLKPC